MEIHYENLPLFCYTCKSIGHAITRAFLYCRLVEKQREKELSSKEHSKESNLKAHEIDDNTLVESTKKVLKGRTELVGSVKHVLSDPFALATVANVGSVRV